MLGGRESWAGGSDAPPRGTQHRGFLLETHAVPISAIRRVARPEVLRRACRNATGSLQQTGREGILPCIGNGPVGAGTRDCGR